MELRYRREAAVGVLLVAATALFVFMAMWLRGRSFGRSAIVQARFSDVAGLKVGDPVRTSGVSVGHVTAIRLLGQGAVAVAFDVREGPPPRRDAGATIRALDFFGARYIEYAPGSAAEPLGAADTVSGIRAQDLTEMAGEMIEPARLALGNAGEILSPGTTREIRAVLQEAQRTLQLLGRASDAPTRELTLALGELRRVFARMDQVMAENQSTGAEALRNMRDLSGNLTRATESLSGTTARLDSILSRINSGPGTMAQLLNDTTLYHELRRTNSALGDLLLDLRANPGRYFRLRL